jgi:hypothetical protein
MDIAKAHQQLALLRSLILKTNSAFKLQDLVQEALEKSCEILNLLSGSISLWELKTKEPSFRVSFGTDEHKKFLEELERNLLNQVWKGYQLQNLYMNVEKEAVPLPVTLSLFSYPIKAEKEIIGAISGISAGPRNLSLEEEFIEAVGSQLGIALQKVGGFPVKVTGVSEKELREKVKSAELSSVMATAVTLNHEINNTLMALLGNAQLLLMQKKLDPEVVEKLKIIEQSAAKIQELTALLSEIEEPVFKEYAGGIKMLDLEKSKFKDRKKKS